MTEVRILGNNVRVLLHKMAICKEEKNQDKIFDLFDMICDVKEAL